jgi:hypothetical protein
MIDTHKSQPPFRLPTWRLLPVAARVWATSTILIFAVAMTGAMGQIIVHDIIPTFFSSTPRPAQATPEAEMPPATVSGNRGDLFDDMQVVTPEAATPEESDEQFVWLLRWTHIHLFGMNMIFILMGLVTLFLDMDGRLKSWLIVLPFVGVLVDIAAMWLKTYISEAFFWLHIPGGGLFAGIFFFVAVKALIQMWGKSSFQK